MLIRITQQDIDLIQDLTASHLIRITQQDIDVTLTIQTHQRKNKKEKSEDLVNNILHINAIRFNILNILQL